MSKFLSTLLAGALSFGTIAAPCFAAESDNKAEGKAEVTKTEAADYLERTALLPMRAVAVASAFAIGTPIALMRCQAKQLGEYGEAMASELNRNQLVTPLMVASMPGESIKMVGSVGKGLKNSAANALSAWDEPFTAKSFCLEEMN
ncbi:MAG: hypothetical protein JSS86_10935 [Cyanobacteria bacterium SZAS LIN-2]|nr:hypothetical protein [Cyanobacteria bacterium SZAS LIN-3]MBS1996820.1 hypothetical protein [Cyanobacteria bacterium SZAS LIN-2]MBS2009716.1 hypothetical protein [Cyanobacteria bacterium SZAS TMP-1]